MKLLKSKSARYATSAILVSSLFTACGGGGGGGSPAAAPPAAQVPAATLVSTSPQNNTTKVQAQTSIAMVFNAALDPATVLASNVLVTGGGVAAPVSVSYNAATFTLTLRPQNPLNAGVQYTVAIPGIRDAAGNAIANSNVSFKTFITGTPRNDEYNSAGVLTGYSLGTLDAADNIVQITNYASPSNDVLSYQTIEYDARSNPSRYVSYAAGADKKVGGTDDVVQTLITKTYDANGNIVQVVNSAPGADGKAFTSDDTISNFIVNSYNASGYLSKVTNYSGAGADGKVGTADDVVVSYTTKAYNAANAQTQEINYGPDNVPTTFSTLTYDASGNLTDRVTFKGPGTDKQALTADDSIDFIAKSAFDGNGNVTRVVFYDGPGSDGIWRNADDKIGGYIDFVFNTIGLSTQKSYNGTGTDTIWFNGNDTFRDRTKVNYDASGNFLSRVTYVAPGPDGIWDNTDDLIGQATTFFGF
jgi:Bacterial Ig-like domain